MTTDAARKTLSKILKGCSSSRRRKFGARHTGWQAVLPNGEIAYFFERRHHQIYRGGKKSDGGFLNPSDALASDAATWMLEHEALRALNKDGVQWIAIFTVDTGDLFLSSMDQWHDRSIVRDMNLAGYRDTVRHLGIHNMLHRHYGSDLMVRSPKLKKPSR